MDLDLSLAELQTRFRMVCFLNPEEPREARRTRKKGRKVKNRTGVIRGWRSWQRRPIPYGGWGFRDLKYGTLLVGTERPSGMCSILLRDDTVPTWQRRLASQSIRNPRAAAQCTRRTCGRLSTGRLPSSIRRRRGAASSAAGRYRAMLLFWHRFIYLAWITSGYQCPFLYLHRWTFLLLIIIVGYSIHFKIIHPSRWRFAGTPPLIAAAIND
jgi:hypothetical protein